MHCADGGSKLGTKHGALSLPAFLPDATRGVVKGLDARDLSECGVHGVVVNVFHLRTLPGLQVVRRAGGIHAFMGWRGPVMSDSGGFQILSLLSKSPSLGQATAKGLRVRISPRKKSVLFSPEKSIGDQLRIGADVLVCLDYCTHPEMPKSVQEESVRKTLDWARRSKNELHRRRPDPSDRPLLFAVVQGGESRSLRRRCFEELAEIGFDGFGFGGWPVSKEGRLLDMAYYVAELIPHHYPKWGLGVGNPDALIAALRAGYSIFDCSLPTRDARHGRLYLSSQKAIDLSVALEGFYSRLYIGDDRFVADPHPVDEHCTCSCCTTYSRAYVRHLYRIRDPLYTRLASMHNLAFYARIVDAWRRRENGAVDGGVYEAQRRDTCHSG